MYLMEPWEHQSLSLTQVGVTPQTEITQSAILKVTFPPSTTVPIESTTEVSETNKPADVKIETYEEVETEKVQPNVSEAAGTPIEKTIHWRIQGAPLARAP